jgi:hypothetical protein
MEGLIVHTFYDKPAKVNLLAIAAGFGPHGRNWEAKLLRAKEI